MKIFLGTDHNGFHLKQKLLKYLTDKNYNVVDDGDSELLPADDYPVFAARVAHGVLSSPDDQPLGILICGSGQGMVMAANRFKGIRACIAWDRESARASKNDDDSNILCLSAHALKEDQVFEIVETWLNTQFAAAPRYIRRIKEMDNLS